MLFQSFCEEREAASAASHSLSFSAMRRLQVLGFHALKLRAAQHKSNIFRNPQTRVLLHESRLKRNVGYERAPGEMLKRFQRCLQSCSPDPQDKIPTCEALQRQGTEPEPKKYLGQIWGNLAPQTSWPYSFSRISHFRHSTNAAIHARYLIRSHPRPHPYCCRAASYYAQRPLHQAGRRANLIDHVNNVCSWILSALLRVMDGFGAPDE